MKKNLWHVHFLGIMISIILTSTTACNTSTQLETNQTNQLAKKNNTEPVSQVTLDEFRKMTVEQRWQTASPSRRNYIRENLDKYPDYAKIVAQEPNKEYEPPVPQVRDLTQTSNTPPPEQRTPAEWWATFSEERKTYMKQHPEFYPEFSEFLKQP